MVPFAVYPFSRSFTLEMVEPPGAPVTAKVEGKGLPATGEPWPPLISTEEAAPPVQVTVLATVLQAPSATSIEAVSKIAITGIRESNL